jgi:hypothetical protein
MISKITFCLRDKPESFSFDFDYYRILDDGSITYGGVTKHTGLSSNEFNNIESIFLNIDRFDLIVHRTYDLASIGASSTSIINNRIIYPEIINFDNTRADSQSIFKKIKSLTIKPIMIWDLENDDVEFFKHLPAIRREIQLLKLGI